MMSILRKVDHPPYTPIENAVLEDERLSFIAKGIAVYMLAHPNDNHTVDSLLLAHPHGQSYREIESALGELKSRGWVR